MTSKERNAKRKRKDRNQTIVWFLQDSIAVCSIFATVYLAFVFGWALL